MRLYLVQHGAALEKAQDPERPLSEEGRRDVDRLARFLEAGGVRVTRVVHSGKSRAQQTAQILGAALCPEGKPAQLPGLSPNDPVMPFAEQAARWDGDTMVVGHLPFLARAVCLLLTGDEEHAAVDYLPGSVVCVEREPDGPWRLAWMIRPELLPA
jgi:phosphohistidine phosphatase